MVLKLSKRKRCNFALTSARNLSPLKQFTYMQFQKIVLFILLQLTISKILGFEVKEFCVILLNQDFFDILITNIL